MHFFVFYTIIVYITRWETCKIKCEIRAMKRYFLIVLFGICSMGGYAASRYIHGFVGMDDAGSVALAENRVSPVFGEALGSFSGHRTTIGYFNVAIIEARAAAVRTEASGRRAGLQEYFINLYAGSAAPGSRLFSGILAALLFGGGALFLSGRRRITAESSQS